VNVLVYSATALWPRHHRETVEIVGSHLQAGDDVWLVSCLGDLSACAPNPYHQETACRRCRGETRRTQKVFEDRRLHFHRLHLERSSVGPIDSAQDLLNFTHDGAPLGELVLSQLHDEQRDTYLPPGLIRDRGAMLLGDAVALYEATTRMVVQWDIDLVVAWNGRHSYDGPLLHAASAAGCAIRCHEGGLPNGGYLLIPALKVHAREYLDTYAQPHVEDFRETNGGEVAERIARRFFEMQRYGSGSYDGFIHFAGAFENDSELHAWSENDARPRLLVVTSSSWELAAMRDYAARSDSLTDQYVTWERLLNDPRILNRFQVMVRWHPNLVNAGPIEKEKANAVIEKCPAVVHVKADSRVDTYALIEASDVVVGWSSTIVAEASFLGKPAASLYPAEYDWAQASYMPDSYEALLEWLDVAVSTEPCQRGASDFAIWRMTRPSEEFSLTSLSSSGLIKFQGRDLAAWWHRYRGAAWYQRLSRVRDRVATQFSASIGGSLWRS
jgi:hypothetical protein